MAIPTDPTFGSDFNAAEFRQAIASTMEMGMAQGNNVATFYWFPQNTYDPQSNDGTPYDFTQDEVLAVAEKRVTIPVAVDFIPRATTLVGTSMGEFNNPRIVVTILDSFYPEVEGADAVLFNDSMYHIDFVGPVQGLFDVEIYEVYATALDEA